MPARPEDEAPATNPAAPPRAAGSVAELRTWIVRNKPLAGAMAAAIVLLVAGLAISWTFFLRAEDSAALARDNATEAQGLGHQRVMRGAGVFSGTADARTSCRHSSEPANQQITIGLRPMRALGP